MYEMKSKDPSLFVKHMFQFDHVHDINSTQHEVYDVTAKYSVLSTLEG